MKKNLAKCRIFLCLCLCICMVTACTKETTEEQQQHRQGIIQDSTKPTVEPSETPEVTKTPSLGDTKVQEQFNDFLTEIFVELANSDSMTLHFILEHPEAYEIASDTLNFGDPEFDEEAFAAMCSTYQTKLLTFDYDLLTDSQKVNYDRLAYEFEVGIDAAELTKCYSTLFSSNSGAIVNSITYYTEYMILEEKDAEDYLELLRIYPEYLKLFCIQANRDISMGICPTVAMIENTLETVDTIRVTNDHPFVVAFNNNLLEMEGITEESRTKYTDEAQKIVTETILPVLENFTKLVEDYKTIAVEPEGLASKDGGKEYFNYLLQSRVGTEMNADEMFAYLEEKMDDLFADYQTIAMLDGDIFDRYEAATYESSDPETILNTLKDKMQESFPKIPETRFQVSYLPEKIAPAGVMAYYLSPQVDNIDRKIIRVNGSEVGSDPVMLFSTLSHEGYPGHLYQDAYFINTEGYHEVNCLLTYLGYSEGWATYVGSLAYEWATEDENVAFMYNFDYNYSMLLASLCDIGVNYYGWEVSDVEEYLDDHYLTGSVYAPMFFDNSVSDPGIYEPYMAGFYLMSDTIEALTEQGKTLTEAYEAILTIGPCSYEILYDYLGL